MSTELGETAPLFIELLHFNVGLFHQGPNGAVVTYISLGPAPWPTDLTRWLFSLGRLEAGGDFNFSLFHQGPNGAVITYVESEGLLSQRRVGRPRCSGENIDRAAGHTSLKRWLLSSSQGTVEVGAGFKNTGGNTDTALGRSGLRRRFVRDS